MYVSVSMYSRCLMLLELRTLNHWPLHIAHFPFVSTWMKQPMSLLLDFNCYTVLGRLDLWRTYISDNVAWIYKGCLALPSSVPSNSVDPSDNFTLCRLVAAKCCPYNTVLLTCLRLPLHDNGKWHYRGIYVGEQLLQEWQVCWRW